MKILLVMNYYYYVIMFRGNFLINCCYDFFIMYIALELQSLSLYVLASLKRYSNLSIEAGLKYFIYGSFASGILLYGISLIYGSFGVTDFSNIYLLLYMIVYIQKCYHLWLFMDFY